MALDVPSEMRDTGRKAIEGIAALDRLGRERTCSVSDRHPESPIFGRILVRVVLTAPGAVAAPADVFQHTYAAEEPMHTVAWDAWGWYRSVLTGCDEPALYHGTMRVAAIGEAEMLVGDLLVLPDQQTLGTVQLTLRCS
jgi:hypothetical protein